MNTAGSVQAPIMKKGLELTGTKQEPEWLKIVVKQEPEVENSRAQARTMDST